MEALLREGSRWRNAAEETLMTAGAILASVAIGEVSLTGRSSGTLVEGIVSKIRTSSEGGKTVLRFRLEVMDGHLIPIEVRGDEIRGDVDVGDKVAVLVESKDKSAEGIKSKHILDLTTGYEVKVYERSIVRRIVVFIGSNFIVGLLAALAVIVVAAVGIHATSNLAPWAFTAIFLIPFNLIIVGIPTITAYKRSRRGPGRFFWHFRAIGGFRGIGFLVGSLLVILAVALSS